MNLENKRRAASNAGVDVAKFVFSVLILLLHSGVKIGIFQPLIRIAVPCFFLFSSYYLFAKISNARDEKEERKILKGFVVRNVKLYAFWLIIQSPFIFSQWQGVTAKQILVFLRGLCFGSTFGASWYLSIVVIDSCLIYFLSKKWSDKWLLWLGGICYLACLLFSNYYGLIRWCLPIRYAFTAFITVFGSVVTGIPAGVLWIVTGKLLAQRQNQFRRENYWILPVGIIALLVEQTIVQHFQIALRDDQYITLIPVCVALFQILMNAKWQWGFSKILRNTSTMIYTSHGSMLTIFATLFPTATEREEIHFCMALAGTLILSALFLLLERVKGFSWLKYAH